MEDAADFHDWEILLAPDAAGDGHLNPSYAACQVADGSEDGAYLPDYFALDSEKLYRKGAASANGNAAAKEIVPESSSPDIDRPKDDEPGFAGVEFLTKENGFLWSDESSDGHRSLACGARCEEDGMEYGVKGNGVSWSEGSSEGQSSLAGSVRGDLGETGGSESEGLDEGLMEKSGDIGVGELDMIDRTEAKEDYANPSLSDESAKSGEEPFSIVGKGEERNGEKKGMVLWKLPLEILKFCAFRVKPVWSISIAAAVLGVLVLGKRLQRMNHDKRNIPLKITLDEKKASQLKVQVARLNEAFSVVRSTPIIRPQLPAGAVVPWSMLSLPP